jgi:hypothetical protein
MQKSSGEDRSGSVKKDPADDKAEGVLCDNAAGKWGYLASPRIVACVHYQGLNR